MPESSSSVKPPTSTALPRASTTGNNPSIANGLVLAKSRHIFATPEVSSSPRPSPTIGYPQLEEEQDAGPIIDPISRQILERTKSSQGGTRSTVPESNLAPSQKSHGNLPASEAQTHSSTPKDTGLGLMNKAAKDKKKGGSLLSRFIGNKKKTAPAQPGEDVKSLSDGQPSEADTEAFSRPIGFPPAFSPPPRYLKVKANHRKQKEFEKTFLAQVLLERRQRSRRKFSGDEEIVHIDEVPAGPGQPLKRAVWAMSFSKDGRYLAAAGQDKRVRVWAVISSRHERAAHEADEERNPGHPGVRLSAPVLNTKLVRTYPGHTSSILALSWSKNNFLLSSSMDKTVRLWHVSRDECLCVFKHHDFVTSIAFHPRDDRFFLAGSLDAKLRLWSIPDKSVAFCASVQDMVTAVGFTPDGKTCIAGCLNGLCLFYDTNRLKLHSQIHVRSARGRNAKGSKITGIDTITLPPGDPHGDIKLLITSNDSRIRMYNYKDRNLEIKFRGNENTCSQIHATFSDDGQYIICGSEDKKIYIWPTGPSDKQDQDRRPVEIIEAHSAVVTAALLAPVRTRQYLAQSGDPIYDLCNPPPITMDGEVSPTDTQVHNGSSRSIHESPDGSNLLARAHQQPTQESPAYLARQAHPSGRIIVAADNLGQIKILRQDCAFAKRRFDLLENASVFSRTRLLGRSSSMTTSLSSARNSISQLSLRNPSADRIISWRNSVAGGTPNMAFGQLGTDTTRTLHRGRSGSPRNSGTQTPSRLQPLTPTPPSLTTMSSSSTHEKSSAESNRLGKAEHVDVPISAPTVLNPNQASRISEADPLTGHKMAAPKGNANA